MLLQFKFKNFKSFKEETILNMEATSIKDHNNSLIEINNIKTLPVAGIYGANASGKSNLFEAFNFMQIYLSAKANDFIKSKIGFIFDDNTYKEATEFEVCLYLKELDKEIRYGFSVFDNKFLEEWLYTKAFSKTPNIKEKCVFYRNADNKIESDIKDYNIKKEIEFVASVTTSNELMLTNIGKRNIIEYSKVYYYLLMDSKFINYSYIIDENIYRNQLLLKFLYEHKNNINILSKALNKIDNAIKRIEIKKKNNENLEIYYYVDSIHLNSNNEEVAFPFEKESCGTKKYFGLILYIIDAMETGKPIFVDELDSKLHPLLLRYIVRQFHDKDVNKNGGQLIFSAHNIICLNSKDLRRDEIWFVEKKNQVSELYSLYDFRDSGARNDLEFGKNYLSGRFGAIPFE